MFCLATPGMLLTDARDRGISAQPISVASTERWKDTQKIGWREFKRRNLAPYENVK